MRISDWSSDVCSSDLSEARASQHFHFQSDKAFFQRLHLCVGKGRIPPPQGIYGARMLADRAAGFAHIRCVRQHFQKPSFLLFCIAALRCPPLLRRAVPSSGIRTSDHKLFPAALLSCRHVPAPSPQKGTNKKETPTKIGRAHV